MELIREYSKTDDLIEAVPKKRAILHIIGGAVHEISVPDDVEIMVLDMDYAKEFYGGRDYHGVTCPKCNVRSHEVAWNAATALDFGVSPEENMTPIHMVDVTDDPDMGFTCPNCFEVSEAQELNDVGQDN